MGNEILLKIENLSAVYGNNEVLSNVSFEVRRGDFIGLAGPNGAGKTTLIKIILGLLKPAGGKINIFQKERSVFSDFKKIGYLPQRYSHINLLFPASVKEVIQLGLLQTKKEKISPAEKKSRVKEILEKLEINDLADKMFAELSGGQQQKVLLARALVCHPEVLILDEPSAALDPQSRRAFFKLAQKLNQQEKTTIILITHDTGYIGTFANKLLYLDGRVIFFGDIKDFCPAEKRKNGNCFEKIDRHIIWHQYE